MANEAGKNERRLAITFWDGINAVVGKAIAKAQELFHAENMRSKIIGTMEKREGSIVIGTNTHGGRFSARDNYDIAYISTSKPLINGVYRLSASSEPFSTLNINVSDRIYIIDYPTPTGTFNLRISVGDDLTITEVPMHGVMDRAFAYLDNTDYSDVGIYTLKSNVWTGLADPNAHSIAGGNFSHTVMDGKIFFANGRSNNFYIDTNSPVVGTQTDGLNVLSSTSTQANALGSLYNSPRAHIVNAYKSRLYLANYDWQGVHYGTSLLVSSYPLGIVTLIQGDVLAAGGGGVWTLPVTENTYVYSDTYANTYEVWRLNTKVADIKVTSMDDLNIYVNNADITWYIATHTFLSQDQVFVTGTSTGAKVYRWPNNPTLNGQDIKQYSTFKLSGADESDITLVQNVGNVMIIANRSIMASWNDSIVNYFDLGIGCVSPRGFVKAYGAMYFLHYTGVYATSGGMPNIISSPIKPYIENATKAGLENAVAGRKSRSVFFAIGDSKVLNPDGSIKRNLKDVVLEYHITQQNWYVHTGIPASSFETWIDDYDPSRLLYADNTTKDIKVFLEGDTDDGKEIFMRADTNPFPIAANVEELSNPQLVIIESERGSSMECYVSIDGDDYYPLEGQAEKGITRLRVHGKDGGIGNPPVGHYISLSFRDGSTQRCKVSRVAITFVPTGTSNPQ